MEVYYIVCFFIIGTVFGSFFNVVGDRLPRNESIIYPSSHCNNCNHKLHLLDLIPIFSYLLRLGKCKYCSSKIPIVHLLFEIFCGLTFSIAYVSYGLVWPLLIALTFISILLIVIISDCEYMIINDEVIIVGSVLLGLEIFFIYGLTSFLYALLNGIIAFSIMFLIKKIGDILFKKESMGGGDIKLMFLFGMILGWRMTLVSIVIGSVIGLPISIIILFNKKNNEIPFGPFLSAGAILLVLSKIDFEFIKSLLI